jgi:hypothetical protein
MINLNEEPNVDRFVNDLEGKELIIYEDVQGSKIYVKYDGDRFIIKPRSLKNEELNFVDLAVQKYYNKAYAFFHTLPSYVTNMLNKSWWFLFEYVPDTRPGNIEYKRLPENNLILTSIVKAGRYVFDYEEILEYAQLFDVDPLPLIFKGKLTTKHLEVIRLFLKTSKEDLKFVFGEESFAKFFYNILNPTMTNSFLMDADNFNDNLEKIIVRINGDDKFTFEILNPLYAKNIDINATEHAQIFSLVIMNFLEFLQLKDVEHYTPKGLTKDEMYINLISVLFNDYILNMKDDIAEWDIIIPEFIKDDKFKININLIRNKDTKELVKSSPKIEYVFKIILGSYNKKRKKPIGIMTEGAVDLFNKMVEKIDKHLENLLNVNRDYRFQKIDLLNFADYFDMKFDKDASGEIYPDTKIEFQKEEGTEMQKGKKKGIKKKGGDENIKSPGTIQPGTGVGQS